MVRKTRAHSFPLRLVKYNKFTKQNIQSAMDEKYIEKPGDIQFWDIALFATLHMKLLKVTEKV